MSRRCVRPIGRTEYIIEKWFGIPDIKMFWHNEWEDPELIYKGEKFNVHDVTDVMYEEYYEDAKPEKESYLNFVIYVQEHVDRVFELLENLLTVRRGGVIA